MTLFGYSLVPTKQLETIMANQTQLAQQIQGIAAQLPPIKSSIIALQAAVAAGKEVTPEVVSAMTTLQANVDSLVQVASQVAP